PIYSYRYIGDPETHIGILAQDVRDLQPDALGPEVNGFLTVNYEGVR
ncbi:tail fiber domain-containing protein, partial [Sphingomonas koreensis]